MCGVARWDTALPDMVERRNTNVRVGRGNPAYSQTLYGLKYHGSLNPSRFGV
jgi:hypothetical protein